MHSVIVDQLKHVELAEDADIQREAAILTALVPSVSQGVLDGMHTVDEAFDLIRYALDRTIR